MRDYRRLCGVRLYSLQQSTQERYIVCPFLLGSVPKGEGAFDTGGISSEALIFLDQCCGKSRSADWRYWWRSQTYVLSSVVLRSTRGEGEERPEPVGENTFRLADGSSDMPGLAI